MKKLLLVTIVLLAVGILAYATNIPFTNFVNDVLHTETEEIPDQGELIEDVTTDDDLKRQTLLDNAWRINKGETETDTIPFWETEGYASYGHWLDAIPDEEQVVIVYNPTSKKFEAIDVVGDIQVLEISTPEIFDLVLLRELESPYSSTVALESYIDENNSFVFDSDGDFAGWHWEVQVIRGDETTVLFDWSNDFKLHGKSFDGGVGKIFPLSWLSEDEVLVMTNRHEPVLNDNGEITLQMNGSDFQNYATYSISSNSIKPIPGIQNTLQHQALMSVSPNGKFGIYDYNINGQRSYGDEEEGGYGDSELRIIEIKTGAVISIDKPNGVIGWTTKSILREMKKPANAGFSRSNPPDHLQSPGNLNCDFVASAAKNMGDSKCGLSTVTLSGVEFYLPWQCGKTYSCSRDGGACRPGKHSDKHTLVTKELDHCSLDSSTHISFSSSVYYSRHGWPYWHGEKRYTDELATSNNSSYKIAFDFTDSRFQAWHHNTSSNPCSEVLASAGGIIYQITSGNSVLQKIVIKHANGVYSRYLHLNSIENSFLNLSQSQINTGTAVTAGQVLGCEGGSGSSGLNHYDEHIHVDYCTSPLQIGHSTALITNIALGGSTFYPRFEELGSDATCYVNGVYTSQNDGTATGGNCNRINCSQVVDWDCSMNLTAQTNAGNSANIGTYWQKPYDNNVSIGSAPPSWDEAGSEKVYRIGMSPGAFQFKVTTTSGDPDVFLLRGSPSGLCSDVDPMNDAVGYSCSASNNGHGGCGVPLGPNEHWINVPASENQSGGEYYLVVDSDANCTFNVELMSGSCASVCGGSFDLSEPNETELTSTILPVSSGQGSVIACLDLDATDVDYYSFTPEEVGKLTFYASGDLSANPGSYRMEVRDHNDQLITHDDNSPGVVEMCFSGQGGAYAGLTYYVVIKTTGGSGQENYGLSFNYNVGFDCSSSSSFWQQIWSSLWSWIGTVGAATYDQVCSGDNYTFSVSGSPSSFYNIVEWDNNVATFLTSQWPYTFTPTQFGAYEIYEYKTNGDIETYGVDIAVSSGVQASTTQANQQPTSVDLGIIYQVPAGATATFVWTKPGGSTVNSQFMIATQSGMYIATITQTYQGFTCTKTFTEVVNIGSPTVVTTQPGDHPWNPVVISLANTCSQGSAATYDNTGYPWTPTWDAATSTTTSVPSGCSATSQSGADDGRWNSIGAYSGNKWLKTTANSQGEVGIKTYAGSLTDLVVVAYSKSTSGQFQIYSVIDCIDDAQSAMPEGIFSGFAPGGDVYIRVFDFKRNQHGTFSLCLYDPSYSSACHTASIIQAPANPVANNTSAFMIAQPLGPQYSYAWSGTMIMPAGMPYNWQGHANNSVKEILPTLPIVGIYNVTVTDNINGCVSSANNVLISASPPPYDDANSAGGISGPTSTGNSKSCGSFYNVTLAGATIEESCTNPIIEDPSNDYDDGPGGDIWLSFTGNASGKMEIQTRLPSGSNLDNVRGALYRKAYGNYFLVQDLKDSHSFSGSSGDHECGGYVRVESGVTYYLRFWEENMPVRGTDANFHVRVCDSGWGSSSVSAGDLRILGVHLSDDTPDEGDNVDVEISMVNGSQYLPGVNFKVYAKHLPSAGANGYMSVLNSGEVLLGTFGWNIAVGQVWLGHTIGSVTIPNNFDDKSWVISVEADIPGSPANTFDNHNHAGVSVGLPDQSDYCGIIDLKAVDVDVMNSSDCSTGFIPGESISVKVKVKNIGDKEADDGCTVNVYLSNEDEINSSTSMSLLGSTSFSSVDAGDTEQKTVTMTIPTSVDTDWDHIIMVIDAYDTNMSNQEDEENISIANGLPDRDYIGVAICDPIANDQSCNGQFFRVENLGSSDAACNWRVTLRQAATVFNPATDYVLDSGYKNVGCGDFEDVSFDMDLYGKGIAAGVWYVFFETNTSYGSDADYSNDIGGTAITITGPAYAQTDAIVQVNSVTSSVIANGDSVIVDAYVIVDPSVNSSADNYSMEFFVSATEAGPKTLIGGCPLPSVIAVGDTIHVIDTIQLIGVPDSTIALGVNYVHASAYTSNGHGEFSLANNEDAKQIMVYDTTRPDPLNFDCPLAIHASKTTFEQGDTAMFTVLSDSSCHWQVLNYPFHGAFGGSLDYDAKSGATSFEYSFTNSVSPGISTIDSFVIFNEADTVSMILTRNPIPLPVELLSFTVSLEKETTAHLHWKSATEVNFDRYSIERSTNGENWDYISEAFGEGDATTEFSYDYFDENLKSGEYYYRLQMIDKDESFEYSAVRSVEVNINENTTTCSEITISEPSTCLYEISFKGIKMTGTLGVYNMMGQLILPLTVDSAKSVRFYLKDSGVYVISGIIKSENNPPCVVNEKILCGKP